jgi:hypothetical protein
VSVRIVVAIGQAGPRRSLHWRLPNSFWNSEIFNQIDGVMSTIYQALIDAAAKRETEPGASVVPPSGAAARRHTPRQRAGGKNTARPRVSEKN